MLATLAVCCLLSGPSATEISVARSFKVGDSQAYRTQLTFVGGQTDLRIDLETTERVKTVFPNLDAEIETRVDAMVIHLSKQASKSKGPAPFIQRVNNLGLPVGPSSLGRWTNFDFLRFASLVAADRLMTDSPKTADFTSPALPGYRVTGTSTLVGVDSSGIQIRSSWTITHPQLAISFQLNATSWLNSAGGHLVKSEGTVRGLPAQGDLVFTEVKFEITQKK